MAAKGGGAWKVAYADFVTAMMAFFLVMWITSQNKQTKEAVAQYFRNPLGTAEEARATSVHGIEGASAEAELEGHQAGPHGSDRQEIGTHELVADEEHHTDSRPQLRIFDRLDRTRSIGTMIVFSKYSTELTDEGKLQLSALIPDLLGKPQKVEVRGHALRGPLPGDSGFADLWELSFARSQSVMNYLIANGVEPGRLRLSQDAEFEPFSGKVNEALDPRNARVEVFAIDELAAQFRESVEERAGDFVPAKSEPRHHADPPDDATAGPGRHSENSATHQAADQHAH